MYILAVQAMYTACLNLVVSDLLPWLSRDIFSSIVFPRSLRAALDSAERNDSDSAPGIFAGVLRNQMC